MRSTIDMAREAGFEFSGKELTWESVICTEELKAFEALVRADAIADERGRMCEQLKECSSEKSTSNEANRSAVLGEGG